MKKILIQIVCLNALLFSSCSSKIINFVHTGAINGYLENQNNYGGFPMIKGYVDKLLTKDETTFLFDCGDALWGSSIANITDGKSPALLVNSCNFDAIVLGNLDVNSPALPELKMPLIGENNQFYKKYQISTTVAKSAIIKKDNISLGVISIIYSPDEEKQTYIEHKKIIDDLKNQKVDLIVLLAHDAINRDWNEYKKMG
ncbi:MAG TPA: hypothetical protein PLQ81_10165, partial [bacterium]|nr:hypothetical protein [bacterium]